MEDKLKIASNYKREDHGLMADVDATFDTVSAPESERYSGPKVQSLKQDGIKGSIEDHSDHSDNSEVTNIRQDSAATLNQDSLKVGNDLSRQILSETQKQSATMTELSQTMQAILKMQEKENAPKPKRQLMNTIEEGENAIRYSDYDGTPKGEGAIDQLGSAFGGLLSTIGGLLGGGLALGKVKDLITGKRNKGTVRSGGGLFGGSKETKSPDAKKPTIRERLSSAVSKVNPFNKVDVKDSPDVGKTNTATQNKKSWFSDLLNSEESPKQTKAGTQSTTTPKSSAIPKGSSVKLRGVAGIALKGAALLGSMYAASDLFASDDKGSDLKNQVDSNNTDTSIVNNTDTSDVVDTRETYRSFVESSPEVKKISEVRQDTNIKSTNQNSSNTEINPYTSVNTSNNLGNTSRMFETNNTNVIGSTYGKYNLSSDRDMSDFLSSPEGSVYSTYFQDSTPGTADFNAKYAKVSNMFPETMEQSQHAYVDRVKFQPMKASLREDTGLDLNNRGRALNEAVFSTANEYGANSKLIRNALRGEDVSTMTDMQIINAIQDHKKRTAEQYETSNVEYLDNYKEVIDRAKQRKERAVAEKSYLNSFDFNPSEDSTIVTNSAPMSVVSKSISADSTLVTNKTEDTPLNFAQADSSLLMAAGVAPIALGAGVIAVKNITSVKQNPIATIDGEDVRNNATRRRARTKVKGLGAPPASVPQGRIEKPSKLSSVKGGIGKTLGKAVPMANVALGAMDAYAIINDDTMSKRDKEKALAGVAGGTGGAMAGASAGVSAGAALGSLFFGVGAVPGSILGGLVGGALGYFGGSTATEGAYDMINDSDQSFVEKVVQDKQGSWFSNLINGDTPATVDASTITNIPNVDESEVKKAQSETLRNITSNNKTSSNIIRFESKDKPLSNIVDERNAVNNVLSGSNVVNRGYDQETFRSFADSPTVTNFSSNVSPINSNSSVSSVNQTKGSTPSITKMSSVKNTVSSISTINDTPAEQAKYDPVKTVRTNTPKIQDTSMPDRSERQGQRLTSRGIGQGNSIRQTIDGCPAVINDAGLVLLQTGFI